MKKFVPKRLLSMLLCMAMLLSCIPVVTAAAPGEEQPKAIASGSVESVITDIGTADSWEHMMGTDLDGNRYAGRVWVDKSVYKDGDQAVLSSSGAAGSSFQVELDEGENFQIIFSALGSTMTTTETTRSGGPMDVVLILDTSTSMDDTDENGVTRLERTIEAANELIDDLLLLPDVRLAIVTYNNDSETVLSLASYKNGVDLVVTNYFNNNYPDAGVVTAYDDDRNVLGADDGYTMGTNLQSGIDRGFGLLAAAQNVQGRTPVAIVLTDGEANRATREQFYNTITSADPNGTGASGSQLYMSTLLNAAYSKTEVEVNYGTKQTVYAIGVDLNKGSYAHMLMNPGDATTGFNANNDDRTIRDTYADFLNWADGNTVEYGRNNSKWTFDHSYPTLNGAITRQKIAANINYVSENCYYDVSSASLNDTFDQIYQELSSAAFNPISSSTTNDGGTGVDDTPLIYVDFIGQHMEIKDIQAITLFGASYAVTQRADGTYVVETATGVNPTTNEQWNTAEDITFSITEEADGVQKLEIRINQEILPIIMKQVSADTVGDSTVATITEVTQSPLRVYYTVGVASDILLPSGRIDLSKLTGYEYVDLQNGTATFYSNRFGVMNPMDNSGTVANGDAHVGFQPSKENRYYYHQSNQGIFTAIHDKDGKPVTIPENEEYGIVWDASQYQLTWMSYDEYLAAKDTDRVYTYVTYYRPTPSASDAANAAEEITYLIYADWAYLKESASFYDNTAKKYVNYSAGGYTTSDTGVAPEPTQVSAMISAYRQANPNADIYAVLGMESLRTSRLHNMTVSKIQNATGTATQRYTPEYTHERSSDHHGNSVVVWLGNNGKLTVDVETGIALTKAVTEAIGSADDTYALTLTVPAGVTANPVVTDSTGADVTAAISTYANNVLTVNLKAGQTVYVTGIPAGTTCTVGENLPGAAGYYVSQKTATVTVPTPEQVLNGAAQFALATVTNSPYKYGGLYITKEISSNHSIPESILNTTFRVRVHVGSELIGRTFTVQDSAHIDPYTATVDSGGYLNFTIKARQTIHILDLPAGTRVTVTEEDPVNHFSVSYSTLNHSGETADTDNVVVIPTEGNATALIVNHYTPSSTTVDLDVELNKTFADASVASRLEGGEFTFLIQRYNAANGQWETLATKSIAYAANEYGTKSLTVESVLNGQTFTEVGTYSYRVYEQKGNVSNVSYDRTIYTFDVVVTDNGGQLVATVFGIGNTELKDENGDGSLDYITQFTNTYETAPISMDITKVVVNNSGDSTVSAAGFKFKSMAVYKDGNPLDPNAPETAFNTIYSDAAGQARISGVFTKEHVGTHYFLVYEDSTAKNPGWTYSGAQYLVTVVVAEDNSGKLTATMTIAPYNDAAKAETAPTVTDGNKGQLHFTNTYDPADVTVNLDGAVSKELTGKTLEADMFTFTVYADGDRTKPLLTGTNGRNGNVNSVDFNGELSFSTVGTYHYDIVEDIPANAVLDPATGKYVLNGMSYDPTVYDLVVEVYNDTATGRLVADYYFEDATTNVVTFQNAYKTTPTSYTLGGTKVLHGRAPGNREFSFGLYEGDKLLQTAVNLANGRFTFQPIDYTAAGTYTYTIRELPGSSPGVTYSGVDKPITVTVTVTDVNGELKATASVENANIVFENTYTAAPATVTFHGTKALEGGTLSDGDFTFRLYRTDHTFDITGPNAQLLATTENADGAFRFVRSLDATGTYFFVIVEDATVNTMEDVVYDGTQHKFTVQVTDDGSGQLSAVLTNVTTGVTGAAAAAVSANVAFTNAMHDEVTEKSVYQEGNTSTHIDGQKVQAGDILTYFISYTNYNGVDVVVDILDVIPKHTSYVEGSASHNGTYAGDHINWILNVVKGETVTVSFQVKVDETDAIVANTAVVRDGVNEYTTNEVINHTVEEPLEKDVFYTADPTVSIDGQEVSEGDELLYTIRFTNASGEPVDIRITDRIPANTTYVEGSADLGGVFADGAITWTVSDIPAWSSVTVSFKVTVNAGIGAADIENQATATDGTDTYETEVITNYTTQDEVEKAVFTESDPTVNIDGKAVNNGDVIGYAIRYKNTSRETVTVTITDTIPANTTYVEGSADNGGVYSDGVITWTLEVKAGETVVVSFKVKVDGKAGEAIENTATVLEGNNVYTTNSVTNSIRKPTVTPETGDGSEPALWLALLLVSCFGLTAAVVLSKKRRFF